jgi:hypothetical protein
MTQKQKGTEDKFFKNSFLDNTYNERARQTITCKTLTGHH